MALGVYGKHPARGDFVEYGLPPDLRARLEGWLDAVLAETRADLGAEWGMRWTNAPMLRFWLGEGVWGEPVMGVMAPTGDRVGRRFPLVIAATGDGLPPPAIDPAQDWYEAAEVHLRDLLARDDLPAPSALTQGLDDPETEPSPAAAPDFWAVREDGDLVGLWSDVALADHRRATAGRSYWWVAGQAVSTSLAEEADATDPAIVPRAPFPQVWAGPGLPSGRIIAWFLRGYQRNG